MNLPSLRIGTCLAIGFGIILTMLIATRIDPLNRQAIIEINQLVETQQAATHRILGGTVETGRQMMAMALVIGLLALGTGSDFAWMLTRRIHQLLCGANRIRGLRPARTEKAL